MNGKISRFFRRFNRWARSTNAEYKARKRAWNAMSHRDRGKTRSKIEAAMERDPMPMGHIADIGRPR